MLDGVPTIDDHELLQHILRTREPSPRARKVFERERDRVLEAIRSTWDEVTERGRRVGRPEPVRAVVAYADEGATFRVLASQVEPPKPWIASRPGCVG